MWHCAASCSAALDGMAPRDASDERPLLRPVISANSCTSLYLLPDPWEVDSSQNVVLFFNTFGDSEFSHIQSLSYSSVSREVATI
jgi:hypothetical protein